jgi:glycosyltransferase involved in cell wall biosynthesis
MKGMGRKLRIGMISYSFYESDARVARYAETLARRGDHVDIFSLRREGQEKCGNINGVNVFRIQERIRNEKGKTAYLGRLLKFFITSSAVVGKKHLEMPYDLLHIHSVPDFEVFAAFLPKLLGAKIILDIHDIVPEFYASKFGGGSESMFFKALVLMEKISAGFADHVIISNHIWEKALVERSVKREKCSTILNYPDPFLFHLHPREEGNGKILLIYPGSLGWHQGLDIAIKAFHVIRDDAPEAEFHIYGAGGEKGSLAGLVKELGLQDRVFIKPSLPLEKIVKVMAAADIGVVPKRNDPFGGEAFSTKILEFMSLGVPVIVSRTRIDTYYFNDSVVKFFAPDDVMDLAKSMLNMVKDRGMRKNLVDNALKFVEDFSWDKRKWEYLGLADRLTGRSVTEKIPQENAGKGSVPHE